jgi:hypothetical protein
MGAKMAVADAGICRATVAILLGELGHDVCPIDPKHPARCLRRPVRLRKDCS